MPVSGPKAPLEWVLQGPRPYRLFALLPLPLRVPFFTDRLVVTVSPQLGRRLLLVAALLALVRRLIIPLELHFVRQVLKPRPHPRVTAAPLRRPVVRLPLLLRPVARLHRPLAAHPGPLPETRQVRHLPARAVLVVRVQLLGPLPVAVPLQARPRPVVHPLKVQPHRDEPVPPHIHLPHAVLPPRVVPPPVVLRQEREIRPLLRRPVQPPQPAPLPLRPFLRLRLLVLVRLLFGELGDQEEDLLLLLLPLARLLLARALVPLQLLLNVPLPRRLLKPLQPPAPLLEPDPGVRIRARRPLCERVLKAVPRHPPIRVKPPHHDLLVPVLQPVLLMGVVLHRHHPRPRLQPPMQRPQLHSVTSLLPPRPLRLIPECVSVEVWFSS